MAIKTKLTVQNYFNGGHLSDAVTVRSKNKDYKPICVQRLLRLG